MSNFIYFPCDSNGVITKGFCPTIANGNSLLKDVLVYRRLKKKFGFTHYAFKIYDDSDLKGISLDNLIIVSL